MKTRRLHFLIVLFLLPVISGLFGCKDIQQKIDAYLEAAHELWGFEGSVLVAVDGQVLFSRGYGLANRKAGIPNSPETKFFIGSITKQFTAAAVLKLQEKGLLDLQDPVSKYLPKYPKETGDRITIHHLLSHTSGLPNYTDYPEVVLRRLNQITPEEIMKTFMYRPLEFEPGTDFKYSNSGYILLGMIIEKVSGQSYEAFLHHEILKPLRMDNSGYARREAGLPNRADGYTLDEQNLVDALPVHFSVLHTAGALYSTVKDMFCWDQALYGEKILDQAAITKMFTPNLQNYGYGWVVEERYGKKHAFHGGFLDGFNTVISRWPEDRLCIIVFSNEDIAPVKKIAGGLAAIIYNEPYVTPVKKNPVEISPDLLTDYAGVYEMAPGYYRLVQQDHEKLYTHILGEPRRRLLPESEDRFFVDADNTVTLIFKRDENRKVVSLELVDNMMLYRANRLPDFVSAELLQNLQIMETDPAVFERYVGNYKLESGFDTDFILTITREGDHLFAVVEGYEKLDIYPVSMTEFIYREADFRLKFEIDESDRVIGCTLRMGSSEVRGFKINK
ncbi:MAG: serine hydrolase [Candidatus Zixiibacteriota bacterium]